MKIAIYSDNFFPEMAGVSDSVLQTGEALARRGHQVTFFAPRYSRKNYLISGVSQDPDLHPNITVVRIPSLPYPTPTLQGRFAIPHISRGFFLKETFDVIHTHQMYGAGLDALCLGRITRTPVVGTNHTFLEAFLRYSPIDIALTRDLSIDYMIWFYNRCAAVTSPATYLCDDMLVKGLKKTPLHISNPIDDEYFKIPDEEEKSNLKKKWGFSAMTFMYAGRFSPEKNIDILIDAFTQYAQEDRVSCLILVGQGSLRKELLEHARKTGLLNTRIFFLGPYVGDAKKNLYEIFHAADVFVNPCACEIQSMVILHAMASGLPVIAVRGGGTTELIGSERGGLAKPDSVSDLSRLLSELHRSPEKRQTFSKNGRSFVQKYRADSVAETWEKLYDEVIKKYHDA